MLYDMWMNTIILSLTDDGSRIYEGARGVHGLTTTSLVPTAEGLSSGLKVQPYLQVRHTQHHHVCITNYAFVTIYSEFEMFSTLEISFHSREGMTHACNVQ
jgi:hypothetical protein